MVDTWTTVTTTWTTETRTWRATANLLVEDTEELALAILFLDMVKSKTWTPQSVLSADWTAQEEL